MVEFAAVMVAVAFVVLVGYVIPTVIQLKRTVAESERLLARLNSELPFILKDLKSTTDNVRTITDQARVGVQQASALFHALEEVGETVQRIHGILRGKSGAVVMGLTSVLAGVKAATTKLKEHAAKKGGTHHGR
ncbi:MAG: DUF948 domain-containing protein [Nitrospirae bacterium]|nr:MAG: DUF948 domain-containing protein [Nitrospirota bacterium]